MRVLASFFAPGAVLLEPGINPVVTRDSIRAFMASFPGVRLDSAIATPDTIEMWDTMALYWARVSSGSPFPGSRSVSGMASSSSSGCGSREARG